MFDAALAQLGERQTEDLKAPCSIHGGGTFLLSDYSKKTFELSKCSANLNSLNHQLFEKTD